MVGFRVLIVLKRVCESSKSVVADVLQIVRRNRFVGEIQSPFFKLDNLFLNREWFLRIVHNQGFIKTRRPPGVRCSDGKRGRSYRLQRYKIFHMTFMLMKIISKKETQPPPRLCIFLRRLEALVGNASKRCIVRDACKRRLLSARRPDGRGCLLRNARMGAEGFTNSLSHHPRSRRC